MPGTGLALPNTVGPTLAGAAAARAAAVTALPGIWNLPVSPRTVVDQADLPCCVSCALAAALEILTPNTGALAALFHYYVTRYDRLGADAAGFLYLMSGFSTLQSDGICVHSLHPNPFTIAGASERPAPIAYQEAAGRRLAQRIGFSRFGPVLGPSRAVAVKEHLRANRPVILGFNLPDGYPAFINRDRQWMDPEPTAATDSGHCVLVTGYNDLRSAICIQDSRGDGFADGGRWWMGYRVVDSRFIQQAFFLTP